MRKIKYYIFTLALAMIMLTGCDAGTTPEMSQGYAHDIKNAATEAVSSVKEEVSEKASQITESGFANDLRKDIIEVSDNAIGVIQDKVTSKAEPSDAYNPVLNTYDLNSMPQYAGNAWDEINGNIPYFTEAEITTSEFEYYSDLDTLRRPLGCVVNVSPATMPTEDRGEIGQVKPAGWHTLKFNDYIEDNYLYNRCHLIAFCLTGQNANEKNLITGTRYLNVDGMLEHEIMVAQYVEKTGNHVLYRVTPVYSNNELLCHGVVMEAYSVEDNGELSFCIYAHNVQPNITIDYSTGDAWVESLNKEVEISSDVEAGENYILNKNSMKFHRPDCDSVNDIKAKNKEAFSGQRDELINRGYEPCKRCNP